MKKIETIIERYRPAILAGLITFYIVSVLYTITVSNKLNCLKQDLIEQSIIKQKENILIVDSVCSAIIKKEKIERQNNVYKIFIQVQQNENRIKNIENENRKLKTDYRNIIVSRPLY